ncbi:MAG: hypothetical protein ABEH78_01245 [Haloferacaceae archaeon]
MVTRGTVGRALLGRGVAVAYAVVVALYLLQFVGSRPVQIPAYLLIAAYDLVEVAVPGLTPYHPVGFPLFLYLLAVVGAGAARRFQSSDGHASDWTRTVGGVCLVVGSLSVAFGVLVGGPLVARTDNPTPVAITGAIGLLLLAGGWWLLDRPRGQSPVRE